jgi:hypothetical protein
VPQAATTAGGDQQESRKSRELTDGNQNVTLQTFPTPDATQFHLS